MYIVNNIILLEMPKSGSSFLRRFFNFYFGHNNIKRSGIHNGISSVKIRDKINNGDIKVISSISHFFSAKRLIISKSCFSVPPIFSDPIIILIFFLFFKIIY